MHFVLRRAAEKRAWGERPDLYDPGDLFEEVLFSYRKVVTVLEDSDDLGRAGVRDVEKYEEELWEGGVGDWIEALLADYEKAIGAMTHPAPLLGELLRACADAVEVRRSVWLPSRANVARVCRDTLIGLRGPAAMAEILVSGFEKAFSWTDDPWAVRDELLRALKGAMRDDRDATNRMLLQSLEATDPRKEVFRALLQAFQDPLENEPEGTCYALFNAYMMTVDLDLVHYPALLFKDLLGATKRAIREADDPNHATERMLQLLCTMPIYGPAIPSWMRVADDDPERMGAVRA